MRAWQCGRMRRAWLLIWMFLLPRAAAPAYVLPACLPPCALLGGGTRRTSTRGSTRDALTNSLLCARPVPPPPLRLAEVEAGHPQRHGRVPKDRPLSRPWPPRLSSHAAAADDAAAACGVAACLAAQRPPCICSPIAPCILPCDLRAGFVGLAGFGGSSCCSLALPWCCWYQHTETGSLVQIKSALST